MEHRRVTVYATAQNFHSKRRRTDSPEEHDARLKSFIRRFQLTFRTEPPTEEHLKDWVKARCSEWSITCDQEKTIDMLAKKAHGVVGFAIRCLVAAIAEDRELTRDLVLRYDPDPFVE